MSFGRIQCFFFFFLSLMIKTLQTLESTMAPGFQTQQTSGDRRTGSQEVYWWRRLTQDRRRFDFLLLPLFGLKTAIWCNCNTFFLPPHLSSRSSQSQRWVYHHQSGNCRLSDGGLGKGGPTCGKTDRLNPARSMKTPAILYYRARRRYLGTTLIS